MGKGRREREGERGVGERGGRGRRRRKGARWEGKEGVKEGEAIFLSLC